MSNLFWWIWQIILISVGAFFLYFGIRLLISAYQLNDPFTFLMIFFASNFIILISATLIVGFAYRMIKAFKQSKNSDIWTQVGYTGKNQFGYSIVFPIQKCGFLSKIKEIKHMCGDIAGNVAQKNAPIDAEIGLCSFHFLILWSRWWRKFALLNQLKMHLKIGKRID